MFIICLYHVEWGWGSVVSVVGYRLDDPGFKPWRGQEVPPSRNVQIGFGLIQPLFSGYWVLSCEDKCLGPEVDHSSPSSTDFKNKLCFTCTLSVYLHGLVRDNFSCIPSPHYNWTFLVNKLFYTYFGSAIFFATDFLALFMLHIVSAGKGMEVRCVAVAPTETMTGFSSHLR